MFKANIEYSKSIRASIFPYKPPIGFINKPQVGYHNVDSPMKAAFRIELSPRKSLSPIKNEVYYGINRSRSPILYSKREDQYSSNKKVQPFKKIQPQQYSQPKNISFTNLVRRNSSITTQYETHNTSQFSKNLQYSTNNYLQSDRNFREDTNLFKKLANLLESNKPQRSFQTSTISENSFKSIKVPQQPRSQLSSNKKTFMKNIATVQSISPSEEREFTRSGHIRNEQLQNIKTNFYSSQEKMVSQFANSSFEANERKIQKKQQNKKDDCEKLSFKKITSAANEKCFRSPTSHLDKPINFHLTNSFGTTTNLKNHIVGCEQVQPFKKVCINPFDQIVDNTNQKLEPISQRISESKDSMFQSIQILLSKLKQKQPQSIINKQNQSINLSIMSENDSSELDMEPFPKNRI